MNDILLFWLLISFVLSFTLSRAMISVSQKFKLIDLPIKERKVHKKAIPLGGGVAIFLSLALCLTFVLDASPILVSGEITSNHYAGFLLGGFILILGGILDDKFELKAKYSIIPPILAALIAVGAGIEIEKVTNPAGGFLYLASGISDILVFLWLMIVMYTTKFLDGLDGLSGGVSLVASAVVMGLALTPMYFQFDVALFAAMSIGAIGGFLVWNWPQAKLFLGEGGSTFIGYTIGVLAVISGSKVATALLVLGVPLLDLVWIIVRRFREGGLRQIIKADKMHLHHRLLSLKWSVRTIVLTYIGVSLLFGASAVFLQSREKMVLFILLILFMGITATFLTRKRYVISD